jgi:hypothetical protein
MPGAQALMTCVPASGSIDSRRKLLPSGSFHVADHGPSTLAVRGCIRKPSPLPGGGFQ